MRILNQKPERNTRLRRHRFENYITADLKEARRDNVELINVAQIGSSNALL